jgi:hypothetical protein
MHRSMSAALVTLLAGCIVTADDLDDLSETRTSRPLAPACVGLRLAARGLVLVPYLIDITVDSVTTTYSCWERPIVPIECVSATLASSSLFWCAEI